MKKNSFNKSKLLVATDDLDIKLTQIKKSITVDSKSTENKKRNMLSSFLDWLVR